jgi:hypothetical protein
MKLRKKTYVIYLQFPIRKLSLFFIRSQFYIWFLIGKLNSQIWRRIFLFLNAISVPA